MSKTRRQVMQSPPIYSTVNIHTLENGRHTRQGWLFLGRIYYSDGDSSEVVEAHKASVVVNPPPMSRHAWESIVNRIEVEYYD